MRQEQEATCGRTTISNGLMNLREKFSNKITISILLVMRPLHRFSATEAL
jgi:hypothetical protein